MIRELYKPKSSFYTTPTKKSIKADTWIKVIAKATATAKTWYTYNQLINKVENLWIDIELSTHIVYECTTTAKDKIHCIKQIVWVSNSEWTLFKRCSSDNCLWLMECKQRDDKWKCIKYWVIKYESKKHAISDWIRRYNNKRYNLNWKDWIVRASYCTSTCSFWVSNYWDAIKKLDI